MNFKKIILISFSILLCEIGFAQDKSYTSAKDSDPAAKAILDKVRAKYEAYKTMKANFALTIELPEEQPEIQKGKLSLKGDAFRLEADAQTMVSNGETMWLHMKNNEEVQINDVEEDDGEILSPNSFLKFYEAEEFVYVLTNEMTESGQVVQQIEFKPLDEESEYHKVRLTVNKKNSEVLRIKAFAKDGSRFTFELNEVIANPTIDDSVFQFTKSECPTCHWEDLRM